LWSQKIFVDILQPTIAADLLNAQRVRNDYRSAALKNLAQWWSDGLINQFTGIDMAKIHPQSIRFNPAKLQDFAKSLGFGVGDIIDALAYAIFNGTATKEISDLVAGPYDDYVAYAVVGRRNGPTIIITDSTADAQRAHPMEHRLRAALFVDNINLDTWSSSQAGRVDSRVFLCFGYEYLNYDDIDHFARRCSLTVAVCDHLLREEAQNMPRVTAPRIWWDEPTGTYAVATPYNIQFVEWLKLVERQHKNWDGEAKIWYIAPQVVDQVRDKIKAIFGTCHFTGPAAGPKVVLAAPTDAFGKFAKLVGVEAMTKAYRDAALRFHSDRGGNDKQMAELNVLWKQIKEAL